MWSCFQWESGYYRPLAAMHNNPTYSGLVGRESDYHNMKNFPKSKFIRSSQKAGKRHAEFLDTHF